MNLLAYTWLISVVDGKYRTVKCLLAHDGFVDMPDSKGRTALQWASDCTNV